MDTPNVVDILNELLGAEQASIANRLLESTVFISHTAVEGVEAVRRMAREGGEHAEWLAGLILDLGGSLAPRITDTRSADLHFQDLHHALPRLVQCREELIRKYTLASARLDSTAEAAGVVSRILARHKEHLGVVNRLADKTAPSTS